MARRPSETLFQTALQKCPCSVAPAQAGARPEAQLQLFEHVGFRQNAQTTEAVLQAGLLPAQERRKGHFAKISACVFYEDCGFHAYDYAVSRRAYLCRYKLP